MTAFDVAVAFTLQAEGGLEDNPDDSGGITNMGITIHDLTVYRGEDATADDVRDLTRQDATEIYAALYWLPVAGDELPLGVGLSVFDAAVDRGVGTSIRILQTIVGTEPDGVIGQLTIAAVLKCPVAWVLDHLHSAQRRDYIELQTPEFEKGWLARCDARDAAARAAAGIGPST